MMDDKKSTLTTPDTNRDPITGEPGSHPVGTGIGSLAGAATGAAIGTAAAGPVGTVVGGVIGAIAGGAAGHATGEAIDPTVETAYWRDNYKTRPYFNKERSFSDYESAYRYGWESAGRPENKDRSFDQVERDLSKGWDGVKGEARHDWNEVKEATRDAYTRVRGR